MKIGIYHAPGGAALGGGEYCSAVLAEAFSATDEVELVHHKPSMNDATLATMFDVDLSGCSVRYLPKEPQHKVASVSPIARFRAAKAWCASLSAPYDLFFASVHDIPPFCHARRGILYVLFPTNACPPDATFPDGPRTLGSWVKFGYQRLEWRARLESWDRKLAISEFSRRWTVDRWRTDCDVVHPPGGVPVSSASAPRDPLVLSIGRFALHGHVKRQREMVGVFAQMAAKGVGDWRFCCVGNLTDKPDERAFFDDVRASAGPSVDVRANVDRSILDDLLLRASIFWHAAGYGVDESVQPELVEHYGLVTAEAMAAGCVPVVIDRGGQREIVQHGVNGFLWNTLEQLREYTEALIHDHLLRERMRVAALARASELSKAAFVAQARREVDALRV